MRISDWSSDVCSSDLHADLRILAAGELEPDDEHQRDREHEHEEEVRAVAQEPADVDRRYDPGLHRLSTDRASRRPTAPVTAPMTSSAMAAGIASAADRKSTRLNSSP